MIKRFAVFIFVFFLVVPGLVSASMLCQFAANATATSQNPRSLAVYATGSPNAPRVGSCNIWSGYGYTWSPANRNTKANITLRYSSPVSVINFTIFGDYDICWNKMWLKNSKTGAQIKVFDGTDKTCTPTKKFNGSFIADTIILQTCGKGLSSTDAVRLCGNDTNNPLPYCGNNVKESGEGCDNGSKNGIICSPPYNGTCIWCSSQCTVKQETGGFCGDNQKNGPEQCDGLNLSGETCITKGYDYGNLSCNNCRLNLSGCRKIICGNGLLETGEGCDDGNINSNDGCSAQCIMEFCGDGIINNANETCDDGNNVSGDGCSAACLVEQEQKEICQFAADASATSENPAGSLAVYAAGIPNAPNVGICNIWSGYGYTWSPSSWNVKANLTLRYNKPVFAINFTIFGDYDICWNKIWLKNSITGMQIEVFNGIDNSCILTKQFNSSFIVDTIVLQTCGWSWSSTDAVQLCGNENPPHENETINITDVEICTWKNCKKGAVSVSVDDSETSCMQELEAYGYRGTFFLSDTNQLSETLWNKFNNAFMKGHELGTHTRSHWCIEIPDEEYSVEIENNIKDITSKTNATRQDIISHAHPCGFTTQNITRILSNNWNFLSARGYNYNKLEDKTPINSFDLKNYNSHGYPGGSLEPPSYFTAVDNAQNEGKWLNLVFHNECNDDSVISYLPSKNVWVDTIGSVVRYIKLRDNATIANYHKNESEIRFDINSGYSSPSYSQNLSVRALVTPKDVSAVRINSNPVSFSVYSAGSEKIVQFDVSSPIRSSVEISLI